MRRDGGLVEGCRRLAVRVLSVRLLLVVIVPAVAVLAAMAAVSVRHGVDFTLMTSDLAAIAHVHPLSGVLSNLGILLWCAAASISLFAAIVLRSSGAGQRSRFLLFSGLLSGYLLLDDFFLFHENLALWYLGLSETIVLALLGAALAVYLVAYRRVIEQTAYPVLLVSLGFFAFSVFLDVVVKEWLWRLGHWYFLLEDGSKWLGIACWLSYHAQVAHGFIVGMPAGEGSRLDAQQASNGRISAHGSPEC